MVDALKKLEQLIKWAIFLVFAFMTAAVVIQVFGRTFMTQPPIWTEEASRVTLLYIVGLGVGASVLTGDLVNVDLALVLMPRSVRRICELTSAALVSLFGFFMVPGSSPSPGPCKHPQRLRPPCNTYLAPCCFLPCCLARSGWLSFWTFFLSSLARN